MEYVVRVWLMMNALKVETYYHEVDDLTEAIAYADRKAKMAQEAGVDYDISIYERTAY